MFRSVTSYTLIYWFVYLMMPLNVHSQLFNKPLNQTDEKGHRVGKWISYWDEGNNIVMSMAIYKDGRETGVSKEYHMNGKLRLKFRYQKNRIRVKYYDESRRLEQKGWAVMKFEEKDLHYYWHGKWKFYDSNRKLNRLSLYEFGEEIGTVNP